MVELPVPIDELFKDVPARHEAARDAPLTRRQIIVRMAALGYLAADANGLVGANGLPASTEGRLYSAMDIVGNYAFIIGLVVAVLVIPMVVLGLTVVGLSFR